DHPLVEEAHRLEIPEHASVRLGEKGYVGRTIALGHAREAELVAKGGLARARSTHHHIGSAANKASSQHAVEAGDARGHPFQGARPAVVTLRSAHGLVSAWGPGLATGPKEPPADSAAGQSERALVRGSDRPKPKAAGAPV